MMDRRLGRLQRLCSTPFALPLVLALTLRQKWDLKSKVQSPFKCLIKTTCKSKVGSLSLSVFLSPLTPLVLCPPLVVPSSSHLLSWLEHSVSPRSLPS